MAAACMAATTSCMLAVLSSQLREKILTELSGSRWIWALVPSYLYSARKGAPFSCLMASGTPSLILASMGFRGTPAGTDSQCRYINIFATACCKSIVSSLRWLGAKLQHIAKVQCRGTQAVMCDVQHGEGIEQDADGDQRIGKTYLESTCSACQARQCRLPPRQAPECSGWGKPAQQMNLITSSSYMH